MLRVRTIYATQRRRIGPLLHASTSTSSSTGEAPGWWLGRQADGLGLAGRRRRPTTSKRSSAATTPPRGHGSAPPLVDRISKTRQGHPGRRRLRRHVLGSRSRSRSGGGSPVTSGVLDAHDIAVAGRPRPPRAPRRHHPHPGRRTPAPSSTPQGLTMAAFRQSTSREDDPQIHTHVVISTKVRTPDGRWYALDARYLKHKQRALGGLYQSVLRAELTHRYGVPWDRDRRRPGRDRRLPHRAPRAVLEAHRTGRRPPRHQARRPSASAKAATRPDGSGPS